MNEHTWQRQEVENSGNLGSIPPDVLADTLFVTWVPSGTDDSVLVGIAQASLVDGFVWQLRAPSAARG